MMWQRTIPEAHSLTNLSTIQLPASMIVAKTPR
jgi:hypothetical protein